MPMTFRHLISAVLSLLLVIFAATESRANGMGMDSFSGGLRITFTGLEPPQIGPFVRWEQHCDGDCSVSAELGVDDITGIFGTGRSPEVYANLAVEYALAQFLVTSASADASLVLGGDFELRAGLVATGTIAGSVSDRPFSLNFVEEYNLIGPNEFSNNVTAEYSFDENLDSELPISNLFSTGTHVEATKSADEISREGSILLNFADRIMLPDPDQELRFITTVQLSGLSAIDAAALLGATLPPDLIAKLGREDVDLRGLGIGGVFAGSFAPGEIVEGSRYSTDYTLTPVPEPSTITLVAIGLILRGVRRWRVSRDTDS